MSIENLVGQQLGQYELRELLGMGGMGAVYRAYQVNLKREVAIKILSPALAEQEDYFQRFNREAEISASLEHAHIVPVHDYGIQRNTAYVVMRLLTGGSLAQRLQQLREERRPLPSLGETSSLLRQLASALDYAHSRGVIHRDIKPGNIMFDNQGSAYIVDFGIAKLVSTASTTATRAMGTPSYMPPEQWRSQDLSPAADQYALAVLVYTMLTGRLPFEADTPFQLMHKHLYEAPTPPQVFRAELPEAVERTLLRALSKDPAQRFPTVTAFAQTFDSAVTGITSESTGFFNFRVHVPTGGRSSLTPSAPLKTRLPRRSPLVYFAPIIVIVLLVGIAFAAGLLPLSQDGAATADTQGAANATPEAIEPIVVLITDTPAIDVTEAPQAAATDDVRQTDQYFTDITATDNARIAATVSAILGATETEQWRLNAALTQTVAARDAANTATADAVAAGMTHTADAEGAVMIITQPTATPPPTDTPTSTDMPTETPTRAPSPTPTGTPSSPTLQVGNLGATLRTEPSSDRQSASGVVANVSLPVIGMTESGQFYQVVYEGREYWILNSAFVELAGNPELVPVVAVETTTSPLDDAASGTASVEINQLGATLRTAPERGADSVVGLAADVTLQVIGMSEDGEYYRVLYEGEEYWVAVSPAVELIGDVSQLPVVSAEPSVPQLEVNSFGAVLRSAPDSGNESVVDTVASTSLGVTGISENGLYYRVLYEGEQYWVMDSAFVELIGDADSLPVITAESAVLVINSMGAWLYSEPTNRGYTGKPIFSVRLPILAMSEDETFYQVEVDGETYWIREHVNARVEGDRSSIPTVNAAAPVLVVNSMGAWLYSEPSNNGYTGESVFRVQLPINAISGDGRFYRVDVNGEMYWIRIDNNVTVQGDTSQLEIFTVETAESRCTIQNTSSQNINVRASSSTQSEIVGVLPHGETVGVIRSERSPSDRMTWYKIEVDGSEGWVRSDLVVEVTACSR